MANRHRGYGLTAEVNNKIKGKYDPELAAAACEWINDVIGEAALTQEGGADELQRELKDGQVLCRLMNILSPNAIKKINQGSMAFKLMENIGNFLTAAEAYGVNKLDLFQTVDLYEGRNMSAVVSAIHALGRKAQANGYNGPVLGPKEATQNKRQFSEEQLQEGKKVIGLQMGTNKGASQAGMSFGTQRHINDINAGEASKEGQGVIGLQMGTNKGANASGINMGKGRHIID